MSASVAGYHAGIRTVPYDLVKELALALAGTLIVIVVLAAALSSPDAPSVTVQQWAQKDPVDFVTTSAGELAGTTTSSDYGPPYNDGSGAVQGFGFFSPQTWFGVHAPVDSAQDFVLQPLKQASTSNPDLDAALTEYNAVSDKQRQDWLGAYAKALKNARESNGQVTVAAGDYGPVPVMMNALLAEARAGSVDGHLITTDRFYATDYTKALLFMGDGGYFASLAGAQHLLGNQWGMMNETGSYPGQTWLWLYTFWYQVPPFSGNASADLMVVGAMTVLSLGLILIPFIPGIRDIPRWVPIHRLIWRRYYAEEEGRS